jgi:hypothetical protein
MATTAAERVQAAWATGDPLALHREVEQLAADGHPQQTLEAALEELLLALRATGAGDEAEELVNGVWDRLTGWCHPDRHIKAPSTNENGAGVSPAASRQDSPTER